MKRTLITIVLLNSYSLATFAATFNAIPKLTCESFSSELIYQNTPFKLSSRDHSAQLEQLKFNFDIVSFGPEGEITQTIEETPGVALPVKLGWLLGSDRGEWGGNLVFKSTNGEQEIIINDNIEDIYQFPFGYVVTAGLSHMGTMRGAIYVITEPTPGHYISTKLHALTGRPHTSWLIESGELLINMRNGDSALLSQKGHLSRVECVNF